MARVWYVGTYPYREITPQDWDDLGVFGPHFQWSSNNGWSVDQDEFSPAHLAVLEDDHEFMLNQEGVRPDSPVPPDDVTRPHRLDPSILRLLDETNAALDDVNAALGNIETSKSDAAESARQAGLSKTAAQEARDIALAAKIEWKGAWSSAASYIERDVVFHGGSSWLALQPSTGVTPVLGPSWVMIAAKGDKGESSYATITLAEAQAGTITTNRVVTPSLLKTITLDLAEKKSWQGTQAQYNALATKDPDRTYYITD